MMFFKNKKQLVFTAVIHVIIVPIQKYFYKKNVKFIYYDVDINLEKQQEILNKLLKVNIDVSSLSLPVIDKDGELFSNGKDFSVLLERINK